MSGSREHFGNSTDHTCIEVRGCCLALWHCTCFPLHTLGLFGSGNKTVGGGLMPPGSSQHLAETPVALLQRALRSRACWACSAAPGQSLHTRVIMESVTQAGFYWNSHN